MVPWGGVHCAGMVQGVLSPVSFTGDAASFMQLSVILGDMEICIKRGGCKGWHVEKGG